MTSVWDGTCVGENVLHQAIMRLRRVFGDRPRQPSYIQTVARRGYRLIADVCRPPPQLGPNRLPEPVTEFARVALLPNHGGNRTPIEAQTAERLHVSLAHAIAPIPSLSLASQYLVDRLLQETDSVLSLRDEAKVDLVVSSHFWQHDAALSGMIAVTDLVGNTQFHSQRIGSVDLGRPGALADSIRAAADQTGQTLEQLSLAFLGKRNHP